MTSGTATRLFAAYTLRVASRRPCPICKRPVLVRVGIIEKHPKSGRPSFERPERRPRPIEWCDASNRGWDEVALKS